jgi:tetratricopeptide (TPR) repeat protein
MANFLQFIKTELIPQVDSTYRTSPYRIFIGHSLGGITTINALYTIPETFSAYVAIDPSLWWDNKVLVREARRHLETANWRNKVLYLGQANTMTASDTAVNQHMYAMMQFNTLAETFKRSGLRYGYKYYGDDDHGSVPLITEYDALRFIFEGYRVDIRAVMDDPTLLPEHFRNVSEKLGAQFLPSESMVLQLAAFTVGQDTAKAIKFYEVGTQLYPQSWRSYERLGSLWAAKGDKPKAIANFQRTLSLNPTHNLAASKLRELQK